MTSPQLYATFLLWLLAELFEQMPEVGDLEKPKMVFFFDEAHLLFNEAPKPLLEKIEQVVRLIRSKGVGVYFVTQNPLDVPDTVLAQLGNRVQHALRAFTPRDQRAVAAAAETFRQNPKLDVADCIMHLGVGEALVSFLDEKGTPTIVERALVVPPGSQLGPITVEERTTVIQSSVVYGAYEKMIDRESAYEVLKGKIAPDDGTVADRDQKAKREEFDRKQAERTAEAEQAPAKKPAARRTDSILVTFAKSAARSTASAIGYVVRRGILDNLFGKKRR
jgi:hypothetical protein